MSEQDKTPVEREPTKGQLTQLLNGLDHCFTGESKRAFLKIWIRDFTEHKAAPAEQEPINLEVFPNGEAYQTGSRRLPTGRHILYTHPKEWVGLTDEERLRCEQKAEGNYFDLCRAIESALKEKNT